MKFSMRSVLLVCALWSFASFASAGTINFDSLSDDGSGTQISNGYGGLNWDNFYVLNTPAFATMEGPSGFSFGTVSAPNVAFNGLGTAADFWSTNPFYFVDGFITGAWRDGMSINVTGYLGGVLQYSSTLTINSTSPTEFFAAAPLAIDMLVISANGGTNAGYNGDGTQFALDNLTVVLVPEPSSLLLLGSGLAGAAGMLRKRLRF